MAQDKAARPAASAERPILPPPSVTHLTVELSDRTLNLTATYGAVVIPSSTGEPEAEIATIAYQLDGVERQSRPVVFAINGGPGFASAWLQLGAMGPWRVPMGAPADPAHGTPSAQVELLANNDTWLDFADLVFTDPAGTGYSRFVTRDEAARKRMWSVEGDIDYLAATIRRWLEANDRVLSPKFIVGESYGAFRAPRIVRNLQRVEGIGIGGLVLVSPELDTGGHSQA